MNANQIYTGIITGAFLAGCAIHKTEYSSRMIIPGKVVWKSEIKNNKQYTDKNYNMEIYIDLGNNHAKLYKTDKNLHQKVNRDNLVNIVCREVYDCKYKKDKLVDKTLSKLNIYHVCISGTCKTDSLYVPRRFIQR